MSSTIIIYVVVVVAIIGYVTILPVLQGVAKIQKNPERNNNNSRASRGQGDDDEDASEGKEASSSGVAYGGYQPPSDQYLDSKITQKQHKRKLDIQKKDMPINYVPSLGNNNDDDANDQGARRRIGRVQELSELEGQKNPDSYDYDLDELINEENEMDEQERLNEYQQAINNTNINSV